MGKDNEKNTMCLHSLLLYFLSHLVLLLWQQLQLHVGVTSRSILMDFNFNLSSYNAFLRFILIHTAGTLIITAVCKGPLEEGIHSIQSIPLPFFAQ